MWTIGRALAALVITSSVAFAEGEYGPMVGGALIGTTGEQEVAGVSLEVAFWHGRVGLALEGSRQWGGEGNAGPRVAAVGASARLLVYRQLVPSLFEPRDVELGFELQGIVERAWWESVAREPEPVSYGFGVAVRLRGGSDDDSSNLLAESRLFLRVMGSRDSRAEIAARDSMGMSTERELTVVLGLGALWGGGQPSYVEKFRPRPFDTTVYLGR